MVGKYAEHRDAYKSIYEALDHAGVHHRAQVRIQRIHSEAVEREGPERLLAGVDGILVPGGFGERGIEGKIDAVRFARAARHPLLRHLPGHAVRRGRVRPQRGRPGAGQLHRVRQGHAAPGDLPVGRAEDHHRQGRHHAAGRPADPAAGREQSGRLLRTRDISERHRHRYEFNNVYRQQFAAHGMQVVGTSPDGALVEIVEIPDHPWFIGVQYHPGVQVAADEAASAVRRVHRRGDTAPCGSQSAVGGRERRGERGEGEKTATVS